jgi:hypothetical protein
LATPAQTDLSVPGIHYGGCIRTLCSRGLPIYGDTSPRAGMTKKKRAKKKGRLNEQAAQV